MGKHKCDCVLYPYCFVREKKKHSVLIAWWNASHKISPTSVSELFDSYDPEVGFGGIHGRGRRKQDPPIERELYLTLEEVF